MRSGRSAVRRRRPRTVLPGRSLLHFATAPPDAFAHPGHLWPDPGVRSQRLSSVLGRSQGDVLPASRDPLDSSIDVKIGIRRLGPV